MINNQADKINEIVDYLEKKYPENIKKIDELLDKLLPSIISFIKIIFNININKLKHIIKNYIYILINYIKLNIKENKNSYKIDWIDKIFNENSYLFLFNINPLYKNMLPAIYVLCFDLLQFYPDEHSNKNKDSIKRTFDALHYSIGCKCDYFVTEDKALLKKSEVLAKRFDCKVMKMNIFVNEEIK